MILSGSHLMNINNHGNSFSKQYNKGISISNIVFEMQFFNKKIKKK